MQCTTSEKFFLGPIALIQISINFVFTVDCAQHHAYSHPSLAAVRRMHWHHWRMDLSNEMDCCCCFPLNHSLSRIVLYCPDTDDPQTLAHKYSNCSWRFRPGTVVSRKIPEASIFQSVNFNRSSFKNYYILETY